MFKKMSLSILIILFSSALYAEEFIIYHFNDFHAQFKPLKDTKVCGGASKLATLIKDEKSKNPNSLLLFGGDSMTGDLLSLEYQGEVEIDFLNKVGVDVAVIGNHEFDNDKSNMTKRIRESEFKWLAGNIVNSKNEYFSEGSIVLNIDGIRLGIVGIANPHTKSMTNPDNTKDYFFKPPVSSAKKELKKIREKSDYQILLTHIGVDDDIKLAKNIPDILAIIGGHDHVQPNNYCRIINNIPVCQTPPKGTYLGKIVFETTNDKKLKYKSYDLLPVTCGIKNDKNIDRLISRYSRKVEKKYKKTLCNLKEKVPHGSKGETKLGNLTSDIIKEYTKTDLSFINISGIRAGLNKGDVNLANMVEVFPFENKISILKMSGNDIKKTFAYAISRSGSGGLQLSGGKLIVCNDKFRAIEINGKPVKDNLYYTVSTVDYLALGGSGFKMLTPHIQKTENVLLRDLMAQKFAESKTCPLPKANNRIVENCSIK